MSNPAIDIDKLVSQFDKILSDCGSTSIRNVIGASRNKNIKDTSIFVPILDSLNELMLGKLSTRYSNLEDLVAEIIASVDEEPYFAQIMFPDIPDVGHDKRENIKSFIEYTGKVRLLVQPLIDDEISASNKNQLLAAIENKKKILNKGFFYEFTDGDLKRIQQLINELRDQVSSSAFFEDGHKARLLRRLEKLQSEIHKKVSDVDRLWGLIGDAGIAIGKFGENAKPFVDRIKELSQITWRTQSRAEELPSGAPNPLLGHDQQSKN